jgi:hypothetical protein
MEFNRFVLVMSFVGVINHTHCVQKTELMYFGSRPDEQLLKDIFCMAMIQLSNAGIVVNAVTIDLGDCVEGKTEIVLRRTF